MLLSFDESTFDTATKVAYARACSCGRSLTSSISPLHPALSHLIDITPIGTNTASGFNNPPSNRRYTEVAHHANEEEDDVIPESGR